ncbi:MAG: hypothetical protein DI570_17205 [Phenylobacterium zucineum]|nr:MAG: hypothetical protein DI570_17205 [Phenylobacterium zucineum]
MAYPLMALRDPIYWLALLILLGAVVAIVLAVWPRPSRTKTILAIVMLALCLPSGCYALIGTACYVGGDCP